MPLYIADYLADTEHLGALESGGYLHLIMHYWRHGSIPAGDAALGRIARMTTREWAKSRVSIMAFFDDNRRHKRIDCELEKARKKSVIRADAGSRGGVSKSLKNNYRCLANATILQQQNVWQKDDFALASSSQPQSDKEEKEEKIKAPSAPKVSPESESLKILESCLSSETAADVIAHRKAIKSPLTPGAARGLAKAFTAYGAAEEAAQAMMARGWRGFKSEWMREEACAGPSRSNNRNGFATLLSESMRAENERRATQERSPETIDLLPFSSDDRPRTGGDDGGGLSGNAALSVIGNSIRRV